MNRTQQQLVKILSGAIRKERIELCFNEPINWPALIDEAKEHKVTGLAYSGVKDQLKEVEVPHELLNEWKREVIFSGMNQQRHVKQSAKILQLFNEEKIAVIILKGIVLRELFPHPDLRTMSDLDILVHEEDLGRIETVLTAKGFKKLQDPQEKHDVYYKSGFKIEVHWSLTEERMFRGGKSYEEGIWERVREVEVLGVKTLTLGYNDFIFHLIIHMASHTAFHGFGIRYLLDLVVMIEQQGAFINWAEVIRLMDDCQVRKYSAVLFKCCEDLFGLEVPTSVAHLVEVDPQYITLFEDEIMNSGVHGYRDRINALSRQVSYDGVTEKSPFKKVLDLLFPPIHKMSDKYQYAKNNKLLVPVAWGHHLVEGVRHPGYSFKDKIRLMTTGYRIVKKREDMLDWLEL